MLQDICNCYISLCGTEGDIKDYEEKLLEKCFDDNFEPVHLASTLVSYEPPFVYIKNTQGI